MRAILTYHSIDDSGSPVSVDEAAFRRHVAWLASGAVRVVRLAELPEVAPEVDAVALTFDDGFVNFGDRAWPPLRERALPVTLFVVADQVGRTNAWGGREAPGIPVLPLLAWSQLGRLAEEGVTLGAHSRTHADLGLLQGEALVEETAGAADRVAAETGRRPEAFAYPYGHWSDAVVASVARSYRWGCTTEHRLLAAREDPYRLPRLDAFYFRRGGLDGWGSAGFRTGVRIRGALRRLRALATAGRAA
jgi:peptidoglycan/xylan/chitin deacetylase (PgdA/CDA1 family)